MNTIIRCTVALLLLSAGLIAEPPVSTITVSGAGSAGVDGVYTYTDTYGGRNYYTGPNSNMIMWRAECGNVWTIINGPGYVYYSNTANTTLPPSTGWTTAPGCAGVPGVDPAPTLSGDTELPVQLTRMSAASSNDGVVLRWSTATEVDNAGFEVERREIAKVELPSAKFQRIAFVVGAGTSTSPREYAYTDAPIPGRYAYRLKQIDRSGASTLYGEMEIEAGLAPKAFSLQDPYPNPFNPTTTIGFSVAVDGPATLDVFDISGRTVGTLFSGMVRAGEMHRVAFDGRALPSGTYVVRLMSEGKTMTRRMMMVK